MSGFTSFAKALGYTAEEAELVAAGFSVHKASPDPADVAVAAPSVRRRRKRAVPLAKAAAWKPLALGGAAAYGTTTTLSDDDTKYVRVKRFHNAVMPKLAQRQRDWNYNRKQAKIAAKQPKVFSPPQPQTEPYAKSDIEWAGTFSKVDTDKRQVFGWASIVKMDGKTVVDRQGDLIDEDEMEKSAYDYVIKSRKGGDQHRRTDDGQPFHASDMIESFVVTDEKKERLGLPDTMPTGWWVGFKVNDDDTWRKVKAGQVTGFSIHGRGKRHPVEGIIDPVETSLS